jgi:type I restriction enzyme S subunit
MHDLDPSMTERFLGELGTFRTSSVDKTSTPRQQVVRLVNYMDIYRSRIISDDLALMTVTASNSEIATSRVEIGDVLFTPSSETPDDIGHSAVIGTLNDITLHSYHTVRFRPDAGIFDHRFSGYLGEAEGARQYFRSRASGSTRYTLTQQDFRELPISLPPLAEQVRIADILENVNFQIHTTERIVAKLKLIKLGLSRDFFDRSDWPFVRMGEASQVRNGTTPSRARPDYWEGGTVPWLASGKVNDYVVTSPSELVTRRAVSECGLRVLPYGSVIIGMIGEGKTRGMSARLHLPAAINQNLAGVIPGDHLDGGFLHQYLVYSYQRLRSGARGSNQDALNSRLVADFEIPLPSISEQAEISSKLVTLDRAVEKEASTVAKLSLLKDGLMFDLLTGHIRVPVMATP